MDANDLHLFLQAHCSDPSENQIWRQELGYLEMLTLMWADKPPIAAEKRKKRGKRKKSH